MQHWLIMKVMKAITLVLLPFLVGHCHNVLAKGNYLNLLVLVYFEISGRKR